MNARIERIDRNRFVQMNQRFIRIDETGEFHVRRDVIGIFIGSPTKILNRFRVCR